jgi:hybrid cluster-associated redox disulfide protein
MKPGTRMKPNLELSADLTVAEVLSRWPQTLPLFYERRMTCPGCAMAPFESLAEAASVYRLDPDAFLSEMREVISHRRNER